MVASARFLLDTSALSEPIRPRPNAGFIERFDAHGAELAIASVTWFEALFGLQGMPAGRRRDAVRAYLADVVLPNMAVLPYDLACAERHAEESARLGAAGRSLPFADGQIAAIAAVNGLVLVTANVRHFRAFRGLRVVSWHG